MTRELGLDGALEEFRRLMDETEAAVPACPGAAGFRALIRHEARRLVPSGLVEARRPVTSPGLRVQAA